jgi:toxin CptA
VTTVIGGAALLIAALCAGLMGFAIQRGATCTVTAIDEIVTERRFFRLASIVEAAFWVAGALLVAKALNLLPTLPMGYAVTTWTFVGSALLGFGAFVNGACVIGAIARLGSGEWAYVLTPIGFYLGCISVVAVFGVHPPQVLDSASPTLQLSAWISVPFLAFVVWRLAVPSLRHHHDPRDRWHRALAAHVWSPHASTTVIALTFVAMLLLVGAWAYTDVLAELARDMAANVLARTFLLIVLFLGAVLGGWTAGRLRNGRLPLRQALRCGAGGVLMGWGSLLLPGGNDGLVLLAMPLAWPYAWLAFATMAMTIGAAQLGWRMLVR